MVYLEVGQDLFPCDEMVDWVKLADVSLREQQ